MASEGGAAKKMMVGAHPMSPIGNTAAPFDEDAASEGGAVDELRQSTLKSLRRYRKGELIEMVGRGLAAQDQLWATQAALAAAEAQRDANRDACRAIATVNTELRAERDRAEGERDALRKLLRWAEWLPQEGDAWVCPMCEMVREDGHNADCTLGAALTDPPADRHPVAPLLRSPASGNPPEAHPEKGADDEQH